MTDKSRPAEELAFWQSAATASGSRRPNDAAASDTRSTAQIIEAYLEGQRQEDATPSLATVHYRGGQEEFEAGQRLLSSPESLERRVGADVLAQLGWQDRTYLDPSVDALLPMLADPDESVIQAAIIALGHRASAKAIDPILRFVRHPSADLRYAAVLGLMPHEDLSTVSAMIRLSADPDRDVRDWATFTLGSQYETDSHELREALHARVSDPDPEVRGESFRGLARRGDRSVIDPLLLELQGEFYGDLPVEAAALIADPIFLSALQQLEQRLSGTSDAVFVFSVRNAITACEANLDTP